MRKLIKLKDNKFNGYHPNDVNEGHIEMVTNENLPVVGERFYTNSEWATSTVTEIISQDEKEIIFNTRNSTYKIEL